MTAVLSCNAFDHLKSLMEDEEHAREAFLGFANHAPLPALRSVVHDATGYRVIEARPAGGSLVTLEGEAARAILDDLASHYHYVSWSWDDAPEFPVFGLPGSGWDWKRLRADPAIARFLFVGTSNPSFHWFDQLADMRGWREEADGFVEMAERHHLVTVYG